MRTGNAILYLVFRRFFSSDVGIKGSLVIGLERLTSVAIHLGVGWCRDCRIDTSEGRPAFPEGKGASPR